VCTRPAAVGRRLEVADIFRAHGECFRATHRLCGQQHRVMRAIEACRTPALGAQAVQCDRCGLIELRYHSCRNRHCPKCQTLAKEHWLQARCAELLPVEYFHVVFTLPHALNALAQGNRKQIYDLLFRAASETLLTFGRNPRWLGGEIGATMVRHTWGQHLGQHLHVHCVVTGGALSSDGSRWIPAKKGFLFPVRALSRVFRGKYLEALQAAHGRGELCFTGELARLAEPQGFARLLAELRSQDWVVYSKPPFAGPEQVLAYLGRYTHWVAISNERLLDLNDGTVRFRYRDYARANRVKVMRLEAPEFIRRFLLHVLPPGFMRIRYYGLLANRCRAERLGRCRALLGQPAPEPQELEAVEAAMLRLTGLDIQRCPYCREGRLQRVVLVAPWAVPPTPKATGPPLVS
jgi:putative transposase/transposase-like zinc-binding protein